MNKLSYLKPAKKWKEALPIGNGVTGVMIYGGKRKEKLCFNNCELWSGYPKNDNNPQSLENLNEVRELLMHNQNKSAQNIIEDKMQGGYSESFMPLGDVLIKLTKPSSLDYKRELSLENAVASVCEKGCQRKAFASYPDKVVVYNIESVSKFSALISAESKLKSKVFSDENALNICGNAPDFVVPNYVLTEFKPIKYNENKGMSFCLRMEVDTDGECQFKGSKITVKRATRLTIYFVTSTGYLGFDKMPIVDTKYPYEKCKSMLNKVEKNVSRLLNRHIQDYKSLYTSQKLSISKNIDLPTDILLKCAKNDEYVANVCQLVYNYGKYLMISGSRSGGQALNLQGIWNKNIRPAWSSNYTTNINAQMNYWPLAACGLEECVEPYVELVKKIMENGKQTAKINYGCQGFACNHNSDIWAKTSAAKGSASFMYSPMCGAWLSNELCSILAYGNIEKYRESIKEIAKQAVMFILDYLVEHNGKYIVSPSTSPEASFDLGNQKCSVDISSSFDLGVIKEALKNYIIIGDDEKIKEEAKKKLLKLQPFEQGKTGIKEWGNDNDISEKGHRHFSPLYAFYPAKLIGYHSDKVETEWIRKLFQFRLDNCKWFVGWSGAWAISLAARLHDSKTALKVMKNMINNAMHENLFDKHPPNIFQIDGNFGLVAGINEMLVGTENDIIELLPACPKSWSNGEMKNVRLTNGYDLSFCWKNGQIISVSAKGKSAKIRNINLSKNVKLHNVTILDKEKNV